MPSLKNPSRMGAARLLARRLTLASMMLALASCASLLHLPPSRIPEPKLSPASFGAAVSLAQRLRFERARVVPNEAPRSLDVLLEINSREVRLAGIAVGQRVLSLRWDGTTLDVQRHPLLPVQVDPARVLRDVQYAYWPATMIRDALPPGWTLQDDASQRRLLEGDLIVLRIDYDAAPPRWDGALRITNSVEGYSLAIQSQPQESAAP